MNDDNTTPVEGARGLARVITKSGYASRRQAEEMIRSGRVTVDGRRVLEPGWTVTPLSRIAIDGHPVLDVVRTYLAFHKPEQVATAPTAGHRAHLVSEYMPKEVPGLNPAGRMDPATTGLLFLSNDSIWNSTAAGGPGIEKEYEIRFRGHVPDVQVDFLAAGIQVPKAGLVKPESVDILTRNQLQTILTLVLREAKLRQIRVICTTLRMEIQGVHRVRIGPVQIGTLKPGRYRHLSHEQVELIRGTGSK